MKRLFGLVLLGIVVLLLIPTPGQASITSFTWGELGLQDEVAHVNAANAAMAGVLKAKGVKNKVLVAKAQAVDESFNAFITALGEVIDTIPQDERQYLEQEYSILLDDVAYLACQAGMQGNTTTAKSLMGTLKEGTDSRDSFF